MLREYDFYRCNCGEDLMVAHGLTVELVRCSSCRAYGQWVQIKHDDFEDILIPVTKQKKRGKVNVRG